VDSRQKNRGYRLDDNPPEILPWRFNSPTSCRSLGYWMNRYLTAVGSVVVVFGFNGNSILLQETQLASRAIGICEWRMYRLSTISIGFGS
jgi:hypothetical protein